MSRKVEPLSITLKDIVKILREVNTDGYRSTLVSPLIEEINLVLAKLEEDSTKVWYNEAGPAWTEERWSIISLIDGGNYIK